MPAPIPVDPTIASTVVIPYQFHQVAIFLPWTVDFDQAVAPYEQLGFSNWIQDDAVLHGHFRGPSGDWIASRVEAEMLFNYDAMPMELEFLKYRSGTHRHLGRMGDPVPFISHKSAYVDDVVRSIKDLMPIFGMPFHKFVTRQHTNPGVVGKKRFIEAIFDTRRSLGYDLKLIQKVAWDYDDAEYLNHSIWS